MSRIRKDENPEGLIVRTNYKKRLLLGQVIGVEHNRKNGLTYLHINHFNGEHWPLQPLIQEVDVLERDQFSTSD